MRRPVPRLMAVVAAVAAAAATIAVSDAVPSAAQTTPIQHVVIVYQENHSFDDLLGRWCYLRRARGCDGSIYGRTSKGKIVALAHEPDIGPNIGHGGIDQVTAINNGRIDQVAEA